MRNYLSRMLVSALIGALLYVGTWCIRGTAPFEPMAMLGFSICIIAIVNLVRPITRTVNDSEKMLSIAPLPILALLDVTRPDAAPPSDHSSLVVGLMLAAAAFLWLAWYVPARGEARRR